MRALKLLSLPALFLVCCPFCHGQDLTTFNGNWTHYRDTSRRMQGDNWLFFLNPRNSPGETSAIAKSIQLISAKENHDA
jgi:hypothetical protein